MEEEAKKLILVALALLGIVAFGVGVAVGHSGVGAAVVGAGVGVAAIAAIAAIAV